MTKKKKILDFDIPLLQYLPPNILQAKSIIAITDDDEPLHIDPKDFSEEFSLRTFIDTKESLKVLKINLVFAPRGGLFVRMPFKNNERVEVVKDNLLSTQFSKKIYLQIEGKNDAGGFEVGGDDLNSITFWEILKTFFSDMEEDKLKEYLETKEITFIATQ